MVKLLIGAGFVFLVLLLFCCCKAASLAEHRLEQLPILKNQVRGDGR